MRAAGARDTPAGAGAAVSPSAVDYGDVAVAETCSLTAGVRRGVVLTYRVLSRRGRYVEIRRRNKSGSGSSGKRG